MKKRINVVLWLCCLVFVQAQTPDSNDTLATNLKQRVSRAIYRIESYECHDDTSRVLTGFLSNEHQAMLTSLHGVVGCSDILAQNDKGDTLDNLTISHVDFDRDIAVLTSDEIAQYFRENDSAGISISANYLGQIVSLGFPLTRIRLTDEHVRLRLSEDGSTTSELNVLLPENDKEAFRRCASPKVDIDVYDLAGSLRAGESGTPLLNEDAEVIGIVAGGIPREELSWAIPAQHLELIPTREMRSALELRAKADCFMSRFSTITEDREEPTIRELEERINILESYYIKDPNYLRLEPQERQAYRERLREVLASLVKENDALLLQAEQALAEGREADFEALFDVYEENVRQYTREDIEVEQKARERNRTNAEKLYNIAVTQLYTEPLEALENLELAVQADSENWKIVIQLGILQQRLGKNAEALASFERGLDIAQATNEKQREGITLNNIGGVYQSQGVYDRALDYFNSSLAIRREVGDRTGEGKNLNNIGGVYQSQGVYDRALDYFNSSLDISREVGDRAGEGTNLGNIGAVYQNQGAYSRALEYFNDALTISREVGDRAGEGTTLNNIGGVYQSQDAYDRALEYYSRTQFKIPDCRQTMLI